MGSCELNEEHKRIGVGPLFEALAVASDENVIPNATTLRVTRLEYLGFLQEYLCPLKARMGLKVDAHFVLNNDVITQFFTDSSKVDGAIGSHRAKMVLSEDNTYAVTIETASDQDGQDGASRLHFITYEPKLYRHNPNLPGKKKWEELQATTSCSLLPNTPAHRNVRDKVHLVIDFGVQQEEEIRKLVAVVQQQWIGLKDDAPLDLTHAGDERLDENERQRDVNAGAAARVVDFGVIPAEKLRLTRLIMRRLRSVIVHTRPDAPCPLASSKCVCMLEKTKDGNDYRGNSCWACQARTVCTACLKEVVPAAKASSERMGTRVSLDREIQRIEGNDVASERHEWCPHSTELHPVFKWFMVDSKHWLPEWTAAPDTFMKRVA
jgi:hypothetical protein